MAKRKRKLHDRPPTLHGAVVLYYLQKGRRWTTSQWSKWLNLTPQGTLRIFNVLSSEHEFAVYQDEDRRWVLLEDGEPVVGAQERTTT